MSAFEESSFYEIVELDNGDIALRRSEQKQTEPLVIIKFSDESNGYLGAARFEVARAMIEAGLDAVADLEAAAEEEGDDDDAMHDESTFLH